MSIDSLHRKIHDKIRGVKGSWEQTVKGVRYLARQIKSKRIRINTVITRRNYVSLVDLPAFAQDIGAGHINLIPVDANTPDIKPLGRAAAINPRPGNT